MITVNVVGEFITGSANGKPFGVKYSEQKYTQMKDIEAKVAVAASIEDVKELLEAFDLLTKEDYKELVEHAKGGKYLWVNSYTGQIFLAINGKVSAIPIPNTLVDRIITSVEKKIDVLPLVKAWARFLRPVPGRPGYTPARGSLFSQYIGAMYTNDTLAAQFVKEKGVSPEVAAAMATTPQVSITQEGLLVCYKVSREIRVRFELNEDEEVVQKSRYTPTCDPDTGLVTYQEPDFVEDRLFEPYIMGTRGDEFFCGDKAGHFIRVGQVHYLDSWDKVGHPGQKGLHCGKLKSAA